jgi:hypothetical protein
MRRRAEGERDMNMCKNESGSLEQLTTNKAVVGILGDRLLQPELGRAGQSTNGRGVAAKAGLAKRSVFRDQGSPDWASGCQRT